MALGGYIKEDKNIQIEFEIGNHVENAGVCTVFVRLKNSGMKYLISELIDSVNFQSSKYGDLYEKPVCIKPKNMRNALEFDIDEVQFNI